MQQQITAYFSSGRAPAIGLEQVKKALLPGGVLVRTLDISSEARDLIESVKDRVVTGDERTKILSFFTPSRGEFLADVEEAGRAPMVPGGGSLVTIQGSGQYSFQYPKVYDAPPVTPGHLAMLTSKFSRLHVNVNPQTSSGVDEWKFILRGQPTIWFFQMPDGDVVKLIPPYIAKGEPGWDISFNAARTPHGAFVTPDHMIRAPPGEDGRSRLTVSHAIGSENWDIVMDCKDAGYDAPPLGDNPWIDFDSDPCRILESPKTTAVPYNVHNVTSNISAMHTTSFVSKHNDLQDVIFLNNIAAPELVGEDFEKEVHGVLEKMEAELKTFGMDKHNIVSIMVTIGDLEQIWKFNELYDVWATKHLEILPTMTACQLTESNNGGGDPMLILSVTATKAPKAVMPAGLTRRGGGESVVMPFGACHFPWSSAVGAGDMVWLCGTLRVGAGDDASAQSKSVLQWVDETLAAVELSKDDVVHLHIMVPASLPEGEMNDVLETCAGYSPKNTEVIKAARTCGGCKVEITCMASRSKDVSF